MGSIEYIFHNNHIIEYQKRMFTFTDKTSSRYSNRHLPIKHRRKEIRIPICEKIALTLDEAAEYSNIGIHRLREMADDRNSDMFIRVGAKRLVKRKRLDEYIENTSVI